MIETTPTAGPETRGLSVGMTNVIGTGDTIGQSNIKSEKTDDGGIEVQRREVTEIGKDVRLHDMMEELDPDQGQDLQHEREDQVQVPRLGKVATMEENFPLDLANPLTMINHRITDIGRQTLLIIGPLIPAIALHQEFLQQRL